MTRRFCTDVAGPYTPVVLFNFAIMIDPGALLDGHETSEASYLGRPDSLERAYFEPPPEFYECGQVCWLKELYRCSPQLALPSEFGSTNKMPASAKLEHVQVDYDVLYEPLVPYQIRILKLLPGQRQAVLRGILLRATLTPGTGARLDELHTERRMVEFDALSYAWGTRPAGLRMYCNRQPLDITLNLDTALRHLRYVDDERYLWVDQLCIKQADLVEKADQVQLMFTIYNKAQTVVAWLGDFEYPKFNDLAVYLGQGHQVSEEGHDSDCRTILRNLASQAAMFIQEISWFRRTWVRQEVAAARHLKLTCGIFTFDMNRLEHLLFENDELMREIPYFTTLYNDYMYLKGYLYEPQGPKGERWLDVVFQNANGFEATLEVDRIFALQNLVENADTVHERLFSTIRYDTDPAALYEDFVKRMLLRNPLAGLSLLTIYEARKVPTTNGFPSWVPNFTQAQPRVVAVFKGRHEWKTYSIDPVPWEAGVLRMRGTVLARIGEPCSFQSGDDLRLSWGKDHYKLYGTAVRQDLDEYIGFGNELMDLTKSALYAWTCDDQIEYFKQLDTSKHKILASQSVRGGDLLVHLIPALTGRSWIQYSAFNAGWYVVRRSDTPDHYHFVGPATLLKRYEDKRTSRVGWKEIWKPDNYPDSTTFHLI